MKNVWDHWSAYGGSEAALQRRIEKLIEGLDRLGVDSVDLGREDGIPMMTAAVHGDRVMTLRLAQDIGRLLIDTFGDVPVHFQNLRASDVSFFVFDKDLNLGHAYSAQRLEEYGLDAQAWARSV